MILCRQYTFYAMKHGSWSTGYCAFDSVELHRSISFILDTQTMLNSYSEIRAHGLLFPMWTLNNNKNETKHKKKWIERYKTEPNRTAQNEREQNQVQKSWDTSYDTLVAITSATVIIIFTSELRTTKRISFFADSKWLTISEIRFVNVEMNCIEIKQNTTMWKKVHWTGDGVCVFFPFVF